MKNKSDQMKISFTLLLFFLFIQVLPAQKSKLTEEEITQFVTDVKKTLEKRGEHSIAIHSQTTTFTFDYFKPEDKDKAYASEVSATETTDKDFIALKNKTSWEEVLYYNSQSEIKRNKIYNQKGTSLPFFPVDKKYNSGDIFHNDIWYRKINFETETSGDIRRLETTKEYFDIKYLVSVYFHQPYYQKENIIRFEIPTWLDIEIKEYNFEGNKIEKTETIDKKTGNKVITYKMENILPYQRDKFSPSFAKSYPHLLVLPQNYTKAKKEFPIFSNTQDLYNWYKKLVSEVNNKPEEFQTLVTDLIKDKQTDQEKISSIFYWVQDNIRYIAFEDGLMGFRPESADMVYKNRYGDCKGMANLLKHMLKTAGFDARLTWVGTNDIIYDYSTPSLGVDNHMICTVILNGEKIFLDGTESYIGLNDYAQRIQARQVLIENGDVFMLEKIPEFDYTRNKTEKNIIMKLEGNTIKGNCNSIYDGEMKTSILRYYHFSEKNKREDLMKRFLNNDNSNVKITDLTFSDFSDRTIPASFNYSFEINNQITNAANEMYITLDFEKVFQGYDIDTIRTDDFEFDCKQYFVSTLNFEIPEGYKVDYVPENFSFTHEDFTFNTTYEFTDKKIVYKREFKINNGVIHKGDLDIWNSQIKKLKKNYNDQIVLTK